MQFLRVVTKILSSISIIIIKDEAAVQCLNNLLSSHDLHIVQDVQLLVGGNEHKRNLIDSKRPYNSRAMIQEVHMWVPILLARRN